MTPQEFVEKWRRANLSERSAYQQHFLDLCKLLNQPEPAQADPDGAFYTFERGVNKTEGGKGWADVWKRGHFGWEYKGKHKDLEAAYRQLLLYREDLENPPLLVVCDLDRFEIHTNFTGTVKQVYKFDLAGLANPANLDKLRKLFTDPEGLRPGQTSVGITEETANLFGTIADGMRVRGFPAHDAAHFLMKLMFCMFGEDIELLPEKVFSRILVGSKKDPAKLSTRLQALFGAMAKGGDFGATGIPYFNGGLFSDDQVFALTVAEIEELIAVNGYDWASVEPSIFGTLFERTLDPDKRAQIGAHYTSRDDILTLLEPVLMTPLRRQWAEVQARCDKLWEKIKKEQRTAKLSGARMSKERRQHDKSLRDFVEDLAEVTILDPACGSGNFLYVAINLLLDLEKEVIAYGAKHGTSLLPQVRPTQLHGIEINPYAQELAQVVIWIGYLQWMHHNGFNAPRDPILEPIETIRLMDAIVDVSDPAHPKEPVWPKADFIVGNPPFLGDKKLRAELGDAYVEALFVLYGDRIPNQSDLCCYWFEKARDAIRSKPNCRAGLLATQGIRGGQNRQVLHRIKARGDIYFGVSDRDWILDGATVHVSMVGFDAGHERVRELDGKPVMKINANLTSKTDVTRARALRSNIGRSFIGVSMHGPFDVTESQAQELIKAAGNPSGLVNSDVVLPILNAQEITRRLERRWVIAFPPSISLEQAAMYSCPFEYVRRVVKTVRDQNRRASYRERWWIHGEPRPAMLLAIRRNPRYLATPRVGKHRVFVWVNSEVLPSDATVAFASSDSAFMGVVHSRVHQTWALSQGTQVRERESGFRYTPSSCFDTFPFPKASALKSDAVCDAATELDELRNNWLNPPEWTREQALEFPGSVDGPWARYVVEPDSRGIGTVRYPQLVPKDEDAAKALSKRTLTNLYNERPTWLELAHKKLDEAVFDAYGWPPDISDDELLAKLLELNLERAKEEKQ